MEKGAFYYKINGRGDLWRKKADKNMKNKF